MKPQLMCALLAAAALGGCASVSDGVIKMNDGTMRIVKQYALGFDGDPAAMEAEVRREALQHCETNGQDLEVISLSATQPPYILGNFPSARVDFRCKPR
ncbi:MAG: hypothetical protein J0M00_08695 [Burkholderiales bacterium]|nr:hypothetical protein [Burkholderiales bacterium]